MNKILFISLILLISIAIATIFVTSLAPKMHKTVILEQIIYKRVK